MDEHSEWEAVMELVRRAQAGDREAFALLVGRFEGMVTAQAEACLQNEAEAQDLTQEVFLLAWRKLHQLREARCFGAWLKRMTVRLSINHRQRRRLVQSVDPINLIDVADARQTSDHLAVRAEERARVGEVLGELKPMDQQVLDAFYIRQQSIKEIGDELGVPEGTVKRRAHTARNRFRDQWEQRSTPRRAKALAGV